MKMIKKLTDEMWGNIHEAKNKIMTAYKLREEDKAIADWYRDMAKAHMDFNNAAHAQVKRLIDQAKEKMHDSQMVSGMLAVYNEMHADIAASAAEVNGMISAYK